MIGADALIPAELIADLARSATLGHWCTPATPRQKPAIHRHRHWRTLSAAGI